MIKLEEVCRDFKGKLKSKQANSLNQSNMGETEDKVEVPIIDPLQMEELQRANKILMKAKEIQYKKG